jgi:uncharacterized secreted repeat protein (TIGR03808 family)
MDVNRRLMLNATALAAGAATTVAATAQPASAAPLLSVLGRDATQYGVRPGSSDDQTQALQRAINESARARMPLALPPGVYRTRALRLPDGAQLVGVRGATRFEFGGGPSLFAAERAANVSLTQLVLDGGLIRLPERRGLLHCERVRDIRIDDCEFINSGRNALWVEQVSGEIRGNIFRNTATTAIVSFDALGLLVAQNTISGTRDNGIEIVRHQAGDDGTLVVDNRIEDIVAGDGGSGQHGNGINAFRAANVIVRGNRIRNCDFSGVRGNAASNIQIAGNSMTDVREVAIYAEFGFEGAVIVNNTVDTCAIGAAATNFNEGGRMAVIQGNIFRNMLPKRPAGTDPNDGAGIGIAAEADAAISGNVIENAPSFGIAAGWSRYLRNVAITGNVVRNAEIGVALSVTEGAGSALVSNNILAGTRRGIFGFDHRAAIGDLTTSLATRFPQISVSGNLLR